MTDASYSGQQSYADAGTDYSTLAFVVKSILGRTATATLVQVKAVTNVGDVAPVGFIDVQPMVAQLDGRGQPTPHGIIHNVPYMRVQGGTNAVIIDPAVGDIGICVFGSHDLSSVKNNKAPSNPGSRRRFSMADALYIGGVLNGAPTNYLRVTNSGVYLVGATIFSQGAVDILSGATGTFVTEDGKTVTVQSGVVTNIF